MFTVHIWVGVVPLIFHLKFDIRRNQGYDNE